jgi:hypothetical protein
MIEIEVVVFELTKLYSKEKSLRKRIALEKAIEALKEYEHLHT